MSRLSRVKKRDQQGAGRPAAAVAPLDVHVRGGGGGTGGGPATIGGVPVVPADGEEVQHAVLSHLHRIALATGHSVLATVHDERIGYVVPLRVDPDGSSHLTGEPLRTAAPPAERQEPTQRNEPTQRQETAERHEPKQLHEPTERHEDEPPAPQPPRDKATHFLRPVPEPVKETAPTFTLRAIPEPQDAAPALGTVTPPTGVFGPPPTMDKHPEPAPDLNPGPTPDLDPHPVPDSSPAPDPDPNPLLAATPHSDPDPDPKPTPARGFDAVAEAVLGDDPRTLPGSDGAPALLGEPMAQINEAVRAGRIDAAATLAERTVVDASVTLGHEHPEVLRLRELTAYIAYLAGDPVRSFHLSLDLARIRRRARDAEATYGNVQSAAAAWRAVRDPLQGLNLGTELLGLWTELTTEEGPAADDVEELESARARMLRLADRARNQRS